MKEKPDTVHGRLLEAVHISGYTMERACGELEWLLEEDRWKECGGGYEDIHKFLETIDLDEFKIAVDRRKKLSKRITEIGASQRATAKALGVSEATVNRDVKPSVTDVTEEGPDSPGSAEISAETRDSVTGVTPPYDPDPGGGKAVAEKVRAKAEREKRIAEAEPPPPVKTPGFPDGPFRTIVIDPPWPVDKIVFDRRPKEREVMDYPTWELSRIRDELPVERLADDRGAHIYLWVTHRFLPYGLELFDSWNVRYECVLTWHKPTAMPLWWMYNTEHVLFGKVGSLSPLVKGKPVGFDAPQQRHSHKPGEFYELVRSVSPEPRLTLFDEDRDGFVSWGIQHAE